jgi:hypothetical protein
MPTGGGDTIAAVPTGVVELTDLSPEELEALVGAATWYAKYHERMIAELADDGSAAAVAKRERYQALHSGLAKLGIRLRRPAGIRAA